MMIPVLAKEGNEFLSGKGTESTEEKG